MRERIKTFLLISLVGISLLFTKRLWIELPNEMLDVFSRRNETYKTSYLLSDMIIPNKYLVNFSDKNHTIFYDDSKHGLWTNSRKILNGILRLKDVKVVELPNDEFLTYNGKRSISFYFPNKINTYILAKALDVKEPNLIVDTIPNINSIYVYLGEGDSFFVFSDGEKHIAIYDESIDVASLTQQVSMIEESGNYNFYHSMRDYYRFDNDIYVTNNDMKNPLPTVYVENEIRNLDEKEKEKLAEKFLNIGIDYIGEIGENNGSTIYRYNQRVLKLNVNGTLEYFHPLEQAVKKRNLYQSLITAAEFISKSAGVQKGMYLAKVEEIKIDDSFGYNLTFRYRVRGIPIILGNEMVDFVQIEVFNDHVRSYKHFIRKDMNKSVDKDINKPVDNIPSGGKMLSSFDVIDRNIDFIVQKYLEENNIISESQEDLDIKEKVLSSSFIQDITLSYFDPCLKDIEDELIGVWVIKTNKGLYAFDIYNGSLVYEKN
ncbi:hypothetical protein KQI38_04965 [Tissierella carlieri]|uniref:two-component system activity regulator YycH n=1 Tax=Tissierella carlieri TaxID=689904 RepID=UPI001C0F8147|nr:two-component system activity regulator YycH [Tissierella carlieri]MBU5311369.1 hypothetical protein [Tissierella carlieri]